jgi:hypothetical protein
MNLKEMQKLFVEYVTLGTLSSELMEGIYPGGNLTNESALGVYSMDYKARMLEAVGKNYEATWLLMGDEGFLELSQKYIHQHPSELSNLTTYGESFPEFMGGSGVELEIVQMSLFERQFWRYFHASDKQPTAMTEELLTTGIFNLDAITLFDSELRLDLIWARREEGSEAFEGIEPYAQCFLALYKSFEKVEVKKLLPESYQILLELNEVKKISELTPKEYSPEIWAEVLSVLSFN